MPGGKKPEWSLEDFPRLMEEARREASAKHTSTFDTPKDALAAVVALSMESLRDDTTKGGA